jgi:hypothetical protein
LGFAAAEIGTWLQECGIGSGAYYELAGKDGNNALTVAIWTGDKPAAAAKTWRAAS